MKMNRARDAIYVVIVIRAMREEEGETGLPVTVKIFGRNDLRIRAVC